VSYAHADDQPVAGTALGFISQLVADLKTEVGRKVGKALDVWFDQYKLTPDKLVTPEITSAAGNCASIIVVVSPAYLRSEWCERELSVFFKQLEDRQGGIFMVGLEPVDQGKLPAVLRDRTAYPFFRALEDGRTTRPLRTELAQDREPYCNRLAQLAQNVTDHLDRLIAERREKPRGSLSVGPVVVDDARPRVLLLDVTDDLAHRRAELKDYLEQAGIAVLPEKRYSRDDMDVHRAQMLADLGRSRACVQILGPLAGDRSDHPRGLAWWRYEAIRDSGIELPCIRWRDPDLDLASVGDADARELLAPPSVRTDRFPELRRAVAELALKPPEREKPIDPSVVSVFVNSDLLDRPFGAEVARWLEDHGFLVLEPPQATQDAREEWETNLRYCDSLMLVYGQTRPAWVKTQILLSNKVKRDPPLNAVWVCVGPPAPEATGDKVNALALRYAGISYLRHDHSSSLNEAEMERFARHVRGQHV
jgi:hypothetical protein